MASTAREMRRLWWQDGIIYQIYPRSFQDTTGDGVGDLSGIEGRLDYLVELGVDAVWLSPVYPSPMADFGYDVADYEGIDPLFGDLATFDSLLNAVHRRGLKLILDFVPNHTSDEHPWFRAARGSRDDLKRSWYVWHDPAPEQSQEGTPTPPNNWLSLFGGSAWTWDAATRQFFLHSFLPQQPDLNWWNPEVKAAIFAAMRFWLDRGVDGFRMDVLWLLIKDQHFRDNPPNPDWQPGSSSSGRYLPVYTADRPETHTIVAEMRTLMNTYEERLLIGEIYLPLEQLVTYYGADAVGDHDRNVVLGQSSAPNLRGADLPFNFQLILTPWQPDRIAALIRQYEALLPPQAWPNWVLGNHDQSRLASRLGAPQIRIAALLLLTLRGTPTLYYGDELGMPDTPISADQVQDPAEKRQPGIGQGRDPERTPMLWDASPTAGFTTGTPWLPIKPGSPAELSVSVQAPDPRSVLALYRRLIQLRREHPALHAGTISDVRDENGVLRYERHAAGAADLLVLANFSDLPRSVEVARGRVLLTTMLDGEGAEAEGTYTLEAHEGVLLALL